MAYAANVTKYLAGGSGDNYISDGYIKTVEKIWQDSYTWTSVHSPTTVTIDIAKIPANKKITSIDVILETLSSQNGATIALGHAGDTGAFLAAVTIIHAETKSVISLPGAFVQQSSPSSVTIHMPVSGGFQMVTAGTTGTIELALGNWGMTSGTIKTIVRYT